MMREWRASPVVAAVVLTLFLIVQLAIPISRLGKEDEARRMGWQMFSVAGESIEFVVHTPGTSQGIALDEVLAKVRGDLDLAHLIPPHLCATVNDAFKVSWNDSVYQC